MSIFHSISSMYVCMRLMCLLVSAPCIESPEPWRCNVQSSHSNPANPRRFSVLSQRTVSVFVWWQVSFGKMSTSPGDMTSSVGLSFLASGYFCSNRRCDTPSMRRPAASSPKAQQPAVHSTALAVVVMQGSGWRQTQQAPAFPASLSLLREWHL